MAHGLRCSASQTCDCCIGRWIPIRCATREVGKKLSCNRHISHGASISGNSQRGQCLIWLLPGTGLGARHGNWCEDQNTHMHMHTHAHTVKTHTLSPKLEVGRRGAQYRLCERREGGGAGWALGSDWALSQPLTLPVTLSSSLGMLRSLCLASEPGWAPAVHPATRLPLRLQLEGSWALANLLPYLNPGPTPCLSQPPPPSIPLPASLSVLSLLGLCTHSSFCLELLSILSFWPPPASPLRPRSCITSWLFVHSFLHLFIQQKCVWHWAWC